MKTLFIGTLEGQYKILRDDIGAKIIPDVDSVVSLGNLITCSPNERSRDGVGRNEIVLDYWENSISKPKIRLIGSNEIAALNFPSEWTSSLGNRFLREGWLSPNPTFFTAIESMGRLVTHAGLTYGEWVEIGKPKTAEVAAELLNEKYAKTLKQGDSYKITGIPNMNASPIWADSILELYPSWILAPEPCPFDQIYGSESINTVSGRESVSNRENLLFYIDKISYRKFGSLVGIKGAVFRGICPELPMKQISSLPKEKAFYVETSVT